MSMFFEPLLTPPDSRVKVSRYVSQDSDREEAQRQVLHLLPTC